MTPSRRRYAMFRSLALAAALLCAGCESYGDLTADAFDPGTASQGQFVRDSDMCTDRANIPRDYREAGAYGTHTERHEIFNAAYTACMVARGYRQRSVQFAAPYDVRL